MWRQVEADGVAFIGEKKRDQVDLTSEGDEEDAESNEVSRSGASTSRAAKRELEQPAAAQTCVSRLKPSAAHVEPPGYVGSLARPGHTCTQDW